MLHHLSGVTFKIAVENFHVCWLSTGDILNRNRMKLDRWMRHPDAHPVMRNLESDE